MYSGDSDSNVEDPLEISEAANRAVHSLLPPKSRNQYELVYGKFKKWCETKSVDNFTENVFLAYFSERGRQLKPSSLWSEYSMIKASILVEKNIDLKKFLKLTTFMKQQSKGYHCKKSKVFTKEEIYKFLKDAPNDRFLMMKLVAVFGVAGAVRRDEFHKMSVKDVEDTGRMLLVQIPTSKTGKSRAFIIEETTNDTKNMMEIYRKYISLRPAHTPHDRLFIYYRNGRCSVQPVGINTFGKIPCLIATFLQLTNPSDYTGHCFRRSSATLLADAGADILNLKRHGGWKSSSVAESYIEDSINNKRAISNQILQRQEVESESSYTQSCVEISTENKLTISNQTSKQNNEDNNQHIIRDCCPSKVPKVVIENCTNCRVSVDVHYVINNDDNL